MWSESLHEGYLNKTILLALLFILAACSMPAAAPTATQVVAAAATTEPPTATPEAEVPLPFEASVYRDDENGFELDYPADWNQIGGEAQSRGYYRQIVSWEQESSNFDQIPEDGSLLQISVNLWDPVNDLDARVEMRRSNFAGSGNIILEDELITLPSGVSGVRILMQTTAGEQSLVFLATLNDLYLELSGSGDIVTLDAAMRSLRIDGINP